MSRRNRMEELTLRMLGQNVTFTRSQWEELLDSLDDTSELAGRIKQRLEAVVA